MPDVDLLIARDDISSIRVAPAAVLDRGDGQVLVRPQLFGLTANNVTYAVFGERMRYWDFFPVNNTNGTDGRVPVWGFAVVEESGHPDIAVGERVYGFLPMSSRVVLTPGRVGRNSFSDVAAHRAELPPVYQNYERAPAGAPAPDEGVQALLRPLFLTSWLIADQLDAEGFYGADTVLLASASSKTAVATAAVLADPARTGGAGATVVGLTSAANAAFCVSTGVYDRVLTYDDVARLDPAGRYAMVDMAGSARVRAAVHEHLGDALTASLVVGSTHWSEGRGSTAGLPGPRPVFFFAPDRVRDRTAEWGAAEFGRRQQAAWSAFAATTDRWLSVTHRTGPDAVMALWRDLVANRVPPRDGYTLSL